MIDDSPTSPALPERGTVLRVRHQLDSWHALRQTLAALLAETAPDAAWLARLQAAAERLRALADDDADAGLYVVMQSATTEFERYSAQHALFCALVALLCTRMLQLPEAEDAALFQAALTMNIAMTEVQDVMAMQEMRPTDEQRQVIDDHPAVGARRLAEAGVMDALWLEVVRRHHFPIAVGEVADDANPAQRLARLLQRIDIFTAKLSRRRARDGVSPTQAAREALLDDSGRPDAIGATLLRVLGLYPPGSFVRLADGDIGVVIRRGDKAHTPKVASVRRTDGALHSHPVLRDSAEPPFAIRAGLRRGEVNLVLQHERVLRAL